MLQSQSGKSYAHRILPEVSISVVLYLFCISKNPYIFYLHFNHIFVNGLQETVILNIQVLP